MGFNSNNWVGVLFRVFAIYNLNVRTVLANKNITIDDTNPSIIYTPGGAWKSSAPSKLDYGGSHMVTSTANAEASFTFTGIAIYYMSPLWPYVVTTAISLDSGPIHLVNLEDHSHPVTNGGPETVQYKVVWNATGLANTQHTLRMSVGAAYAVVDGLIYTQADATNVSSSVSSSHSPTSSTHSVIASSSTSSTHSVIASSTSSTQAVIVSSSSTTPDSVEASSTATVAAIPSSRSKLQAAQTVYGSLLGVLGFVITLFVLWYFRRRKNRDAAAIQNLTSSTNPSMSAIQPNAMDNNGQWTGDQLYHNNSSHPHPQSGYQDSDVVGSNSVLDQPQIPGENPNHDQPPGYGLFINADRLAAQKGDGRNPLSNLPSSYQLTVPLAGSDPLTTAAALPFS